MKTLLSLLCFVLSLFAPQVFADTSPQTSSGPDPVNGISNIYSDMDMRMRLATKPNEKACSGDVCAENQLFDAQVQALGMRLAQSAYTVYPELKKKIPNFVFGVAEKKVVGSASNAKGTVILFRGLQHLDLGEEATAFIVAREMGHVIGNHHKSNAKTKIFFTVLAGVLFPAVNVLSASGAAAQATTATTLLTSAASTATSYVGSEVALSRIKPTQLTEADDIALKLLEHAGWNKLDVAQALEYISENEKSSAWEKDLNQSTQYVRKIAGEPVSVLAELEPLPEAYVAPQTNINAPLVPLTAMKGPEEHLAKPEKTPPIVQPEQKPVEPRKSILITNETIAASHSQAFKVVEKPLVEKSAILPIKSTNKSKAKPKLRSAKRNLKPALPKKAVKGSKLGKVNKANKAGKPKQPLKLKSTKSDKNKV